MADTQESLLRFLYQVPIAITQLDNHGDIRLINPFAAQLLMPLSQDGSLHNVFDLLSPWLPELRDTFTRETRPGPVITQRAVEVGNDHAQVLSITLNRLNEEEGVLVIEDVTEQASLRQQVEHERREGEFLRGRQEATSAVLHDIGNAVTSLGVNASALFAEEGWEETRLLGRIHELLSEQHPSLKQSLGESKSQALVRLTGDIHSELLARHTRIRDTATRLTTGIHHVEEILSIQRRQSQSGETRHGRVQFAQLVEDALSLQSSALSRRGIQLHTNLDPHLPPLMADPTRMTRVVLNLIKNSMEAFDRMATPPESPSLHITLQQSDGLQLLTLQDNAMGFSPEQGASLFEKGTSGKSEKSGIGLYSCRKMVEDQGGTLTLESTGPNQGATATLSLPSPESATEHE